MSINFKINIFRDLVEKYKCWEDLRNFLESSEGGLFRIADKDENGLCLIRYEKDKTDMNLPHSKWFRSVVWDTKLNRPVCIAPSKAESGEISCRTIKECIESNIVCQELLDGFMINCFRIRNDETLYIASRSKLDATGNFYSEKSFKELFIESYMDTFNYSNSSDKSINDNFSELKSPDESDGEIATFYSFLVQHIEHRIVKKIETNRVYLIHRGSVLEDGSVKVEDSPVLSNSNTNMECIPIENKTVKGSYAEVLSEENEVDQWIRKQLLERDWRFQGLVLKDALGNRWRYRSEKYNVVKTLRGNSPKLLERFMQLYTQNLINKYIEYYAEDTINITILMMYMDTLVNILYNYYVDIHITKLKRASDIDKMFLPHLYNIHGIYLSQLRPVGKKINLDEIRVYLHKQPWQRLVFLVKKLMSNSQ